MTIYLYDYISIFFIFYIINNTRRPVGQEIINGNLNDKNVK